MENDSILGLANLTKIFANECDDRIISKLLEIEDHLLGMDIKNFGLEEIQVYYEILSRIMMTKNSEKTNRELSKLTEQLMSK